MRKKIEAKNSQLCVGIDPPTEMSNEQKLEFAIQIIKDTADYAVAFKPNRQYFLGFPMEWMQEITKEIQKRGSYSIMDHKLSDIGSSNLAAIKHIAEEGHDYFTFSPFAGNMKQTSTEAHDLGLKVISLVLMSNPEAKWMTNGAYLKFAEDAEKYSDGMVLGSTNHITAEHLKNVKEVAPSPFILAPGIGHQGGSPVQLLRIFGRAVVFSSSRGILQSKDPRSEALKLRNLFNEEYLKL